MLSSSEVLRALTRNAAVHLGRADQIGTLEPGKTADLVMVAGNPLDDIAALFDVRLVIRRGEIVVDAR